MNLYETLKIIRKLNLIFFVLHKNVNQVYIGLQFSNFNLLCSLISGMAGECSRDDSEALGSVLGKILKHCDIGTCLAGDDVFSVVF